MTAATKTSARRCVGRVIDLSVADALTSVVVVGLNEFARAEHLARSHSRSAARGAARARGVGQFRFSLTLNMSYHVAILAVLNVVSGTFLIYLIKNYNMSATKLTGDPVGIRPRHLLGAPVAVEPGAVQGRVRIR